MSICDCTRNTGIGRPLVENDSLQSARISMSNPCSATATAACVLLVHWMTGSAAAQSVASAKAPFSNPNKGRVVIEGGPATPRHDAIYRAILDGRDGKGPLCIIPTATVDPDSAVKAEIIAFGAHGWDTDVVGIPFTEAHPEYASDSTYVNAVKRCSGFFFTGGRQTRTTRVFRPDGGTTPALEAIRTRVREGAVVSGTSAGAAIMSDPMLNAGTSMASFARGMGSGGVSMLPGLGFFAGHLVDQHFFQVNRIGRLLVAVLRVDQYPVGFGIDRNTALVVEGNRAWVVGESGVLFVDGRNAQRATQGNGGGTASG
ncbi:MAG: cyanophycinase [bacterium]